MKTQTTSKKYEGQCKFCQKDFSKRQIVSHLDMCPGRKKDNKIRNLRLRITDPYAKMFWLIVEVNDQATFKKLDSLLRRIWVECCGHLSEFGEYGKEVGKGRNIITTLIPKDSISYTYDFGTSTQLLIEAICYSNYALSGNKNIEVVARNYLPFSNCVKCNKQSTQVCTYCSENYIVMVCDDCAKKYHNEDKRGEEHYLLSLANSPRSGVCGYEQTDPLDTLFL